MHNRFAFRAECQIDISSFLMALQRRDEFHIKTVTIELYRSTLPDAWCYFETIAATDLALIRSVMGDVEDAHVMIQSVVDCDVVGILPRGLRDVDENFPDLDRYCNGE